MRTVEAETGWPRELCKRFARRSARQGAPGVRPGNTDPRVALLALIIVFGSPIAMGAGAELAETLWPAPSYGAEPTAGALRFAVRLVLVVGAGGVWVAPLLALAKAIQMRRIWLPRFLAAPWCFKCKYPVQPPPEPGAGSICPECGEPIAPEIARLAARSAEATARISE
ncbi:MAG: hypothetical protein ACF8R7_02970 [Phycisphaerales bacterium JB039]